MPVDTLLVELSLLELDLLELPPLLLLRLGELLDPHDQRLPLLLLLPLLPKLRLLLLLLDLLELLLDEEEDLLGWGDRFLR